MTFFCVKFSLPAVEPSLSASVDRRITKVVTAGSTVSFNCTFRAGATGVLVVRLRPKGLKTFLRSTIYVVIKTLILTEICGSNFV